MKVIGKGAFAKVFSYRSLLNGSLVAVKTFSKAHYLKFPIEMRCLQNEIRMMRAVSHHRIMKLHAVYEGENYVYCVLELFQGLTLFKTLVKKGP